MHDDGEAASAMPAEKDVTQFATHNFGTLASQYITPYLYRGGSNLDREYGLRRDQDGKFRVGNLKIEIDNNSNIFIASKNFKGTKGLFELLTRNKIQRSEITSHDLKIYKQILELSSAHRQNYDPAEVIKISRSRKYRDVISQLFPTDTRRRGIESALRRKWISLK
jgi:NADPH-dependent 7-cyano-7-deazaguanine reductase QueF-like protein